MLAGLLGVTAAQAREIARVRARIGGFREVEELVTGGLLPRPVVAALRDVLVASR